MKMAKSILIASGVVGVIAIIAVVITLVTGSDDKVNEAVVVFNVGTDKSGVSGILTLSQSGSGGPVQIKGEIRNLKPNADHGFHVHESGDIRNGCMSTGGHFNPYTKNHGAPTASERHVGDLGNVRANAQGVANIDLSDTQISLTGPDCILGRAFVVHEGPDDLGLGGHNDSLTTGHAGGRMACGIIGAIYKK